MRQITISLLDDERQALHILAQQEKRDIRGQAAFLIRRELHRLGLLSAELPAADQQPTAVSATRSRHDQRT